MPDLILHIDADNEIFPLFPGPDPLIVGCEEGPTVSFRIARTQYDGVGIEGFRAQKFDKLSRFLLVDAEPCCLFLSDLGILLNPTFGFEDVRIDVVLQSIGKFRRIFVTLENIVMTDEVDAQIGRKLKFAFTGVRHAYECSKETIETLMALTEFLRVDDEHYAQIMPGHRPMVVSIVGRFEGASGRASGPAHGGQILLFCRVAEVGRKNHGKKDRENRKYRPGAEQSKT